MQSGTHGPATHWPEASQTFPEGQVPHDPPHPSSPHAFVSHCGMHPWHCPQRLHVWPAGHTPHASGWSGHPPSPHCRAVQFGVQTGVTHLPPAQTWPAGHVPHRPPHPSFPHTAPAQYGVHTHFPDMHDHWGPMPHDPHDPPHPSSPHSFPTHGFTQWGQHSAKSGQQSPFVSQSESQ